MRIRVRNPLCLIFSDLSNEKDDNDQDEDKEVLNL